jgi:hypothetical protein
MGTISYSITPELQQFIKAQPVFFVASAPTNTQSFINLSPKGLDTFRILGPLQVAYMDLEGSGNETATHLRENGRITFMFCSFVGDPLILRLYGYGSPILPNAPDWTDLKPLYPDYPGIRQIIVAKITMVQTSCGFGVPLMQFVDQRKMGKIELM